MPAAFEPASILRLPASFCSLQAAAAAAASGLRRDLGAEAHDMLNFARAKGLPAASILGMLVVRRSSSLCAKKHTGLQAWLPAAAAATLDDAGSSSTTQRQSMA
jgi:hypothetical protein